MTSEEEAVPVTLVAEKIRRLPWAHLHLPPFPHVAIRVLQLTHNENVPLHQLCELISSDAAFASEVLVVANSAAYSPQYPASSILQAIAVLGANSLQGMCITVGVRAYLGKSMVKPAMKELWEHNLACALVAQKLAAAGDLDQDTAYTAGILHDIGRFALAVIQPKDYSDLLMTHKGSPESILEGERELFGWDHCETGQQLIASWQLPEQLNEIVGEHHCARNPNTEWKMAELVKMSCRMADAAGFPAFVGCETTAYATLLKELPERERRAFAPDVETLATEIADNIRAIETA
jgi:putative nucleotidyltransferase with HDIG domain